MRTVPADPRRRGAVAVEAAVSALVFLTMVLGMIDLGVGVYRNNTLSQAARYLARQAIVHGQKSTSAWGTTTVNVAASASGNAQANAVRPMLPSFNLASTTVHVEWLDASNAVGKRVRVTVSTPYHPIMTFIFGNPSITLSASSTMTIAH
jgi:Flp pilus assembly protein TadG